MPLSSRLAFHALSVVVTLALAAPAYSAGDAAHGKELSYTCLGCHGIDDYKNVYPTYSVPKLSGQHAEYIVAALKAYATGQRSHGTMHQQAASLSDQEMQDIAAYFAGAGLKVDAAPVGTAPAKVALCGSCHGKNGVGITGDYPNLAGQYSDYLARALTEYQHGDRKNPVMPNFVAGMTETDFEELASYYARQSPPLQTVTRHQTILSSN